MCQERQSCMRACRESWRNGKMERACKWLVLQCSILVHKIWHAVSPCDIHCYGRLGLWSLAAAKRSDPDDYTLFRISAFGGYYGIANKLIYFNCHGMYVFPVPTYPCLFLTHQKSRGYFFCLWIQRAWRKILYRHQREWSQNDQTQKMEQKSKYWLVLCHLMISRPAIRESKKRKKKGKISQSLYLIMDKSKL